MNQTDRNHCPHGSIILKTNKQTIMFLYPAHPSLCLSPYFSLCFYQLKTQRGRITLCLQLFSISQTCTFLKSREIFIIRRENIEYPLFKSPQNPQVLMQYKSWRNACLICLAGAHHENSLSRENSWFAKSAHLAVQLALLVALG